MDYFSTSMIASESTESRHHQGFANESQTESFDLTNQRRTSRSGVRNVDAWVRKRALMHRGYQWTTTYDGESKISAEPLSDDQTMSSADSVPTVAMNSNYYADQQDTSPSTMKRTDFESTDRISLRRRRSSRRLPEIPSHRINASHNNFNHHEMSITDEITLVSSTTDYPYPPKRENSLSSRSNRSKSIDSDSSIKMRATHPKLLLTQQSPNAKSVDLSNLARQKPSLVVNNALLPQRSLDYPCIVRKAPDLSDIVRRRMLYSKISKQQGESFSHSLERDHIPKVPRKIIIRQDNSIEIALRYVKMPLM